MEEYSRRSSEGVADSNLLIQLNHLLSGTNQAAFDLLYATVIAKNSAIPSGIKGRVTASTFREGLKAFRRGVRYMLNHPQYRENALPRGLEWRSDATVRVHEQVSGKEGVGLVGYVPEDDIVRFYTILFAQLLQKFHDAYFEVMMGKYHLVWVCVYQTFFFCQE